MKITIYSFRCKHGHETVRTGEKAEDVPCSRAFCFETAWLVDVQETDYAFGNLLG